MLTDEDLRQIASYGIDTTIAKNQIAVFRRGIPPANVSAPAQIGNGIKSFSDSEASEMSAEYQAMISGRQVVKFVPASGAATRMFKSLFEFRERIGEVHDLEAETERGFQSPYYLMTHLKDLPFFPLIQGVAGENGQSLDSIIARGNFRAICDIILENLNYSSLPKGLLAFHNYGNRIRLACEEHLHEGAAHGQTGDGQVNIHFTVSPEHVSGFKAAVSEVQAELENHYSCSFRISYSVQKSSTDTIAADEHNNPFRDSNGNLLFRPGGHGALIENLNDLQGDIVFIKNIDNVVPERLQPATVLWKKVLGAHLLKLEHKVHSFLQAIDNEPYTQSLQSAVLDFLNNEAGVRVADRASLDKEGIRSLLNRPIRVCGMVRNEGEPGGGPFWLRDKNGDESLQIVESAQVNLKDPISKAIFDSSTHFNPVDLVCSLRGYKGTPFDLRSFVDPDAAFISVKSSGGRTLKALELPGLWNGAMAKWLTSFVEVPSITFNPVKTVNDLLREQHRATV